MSESDQPETSGDHAEATPATPATESGDQLPEEWKPEPREWTWKDLFTAPMLAFKPKCMLISVITMLLIGVFCWLWFEQLLGAAGAGALAVVGPTLHWVGIAIAAAIFGLGATLVSIFMKADLLDDEFLSFKEALGQFKGRCLAAVMVPLFLVGVLAGFKLLIYLGELLCSIPYAGSVIYAIFYPLAVLLALFTVLLGIGVLLSVFVGPAVVSVRRHGWFDNVIDTFEAVGTKPHVLVGNLILTLLMVGICYGIAHFSMITLSVQAASRHLPTAEVALADYRGSRISSRLQPWYDVVAYQLPATALSVEATRGEVGRKLAIRQEAEITAAQERLDQARESADQERIAAARDRLDAAYTGDSRLPGYYQWFTGLLVGGWKVLLSALIAGYAVNIFLAGGMLTYLAVREDDYWDDEDLEDLDQLAKELEEEAKREEAAAEAAPAPAAEATPPQDAGTPGVQEQAAETPPEGEKTQISKPDADEQKPDEQKPAAKKPSQGRKKTEGGKKSEGRKKTEGGQKSEDRKKTEGGQKDQDEDQKSD